jgi:hypothetical protein
VFHIELRQFPHVARAFNLSEEEVERRFLGPFARDQMIELDDRRWAPERVKLTIYEGPELRSDEIGLGRGWANATKSGEDVTARVVALARQAAGSQPAQAAAPSSVEEVKQEILGRCASTSVGIEDVVAIVNAGFGLRRVSERLALAEQAVWELLHQGRVSMVRAGNAVPKEEWAPVLLSWETWVAAGERRVSLEAADPSH